MQILYFVITLLNEKNTVIVKLHYMIMACCTEFFEKKWDTPICVHTYVAHLFFKHFADFRILALLNTLQAWS